MDKFCTKCGRELVPGQPCSFCLQGKVEEGKSSVNEGQEEQVIYTEVVHDQVVKNALNLWKIFISMIKEPVTTMNRIVKDSYMVNGMLYCLLECILGGLWVCTLIHGLMRMAYGGISSAVNSLSGGYLSAGGSYSDYVNIPYVEIFFRILLLLLIVKAVFVFVNMGMLRGLGKANVTVKSAFTAAAGYSTAMIAGGVISIVLNFINPIPGAVVYSLSASLAIIMYVTSITGIKNVKRNSCVWVAFLTLLLSSLCAIFLYASLLSTYINSISNFF
jgi:hypothetical protein